MTQDNSISAIILEEAILEEAMDWFLKLQANPDCPITQDDFRSWVSRSSEHELAFAQAVKTWKLLGEVPPAHQHLWPSALPVESHQPARRRRRGPMLAGAILAIAACVIVLLAGPSFLIRWQADHMTTTAESRKLTLGDGTVVDMGGDSAIATAITASSRHVTLLKGEAFFEVAHDATRPFTVDAGGVEVMVLGTAFDVQLAESETTVELARGTVAIAYARDDHKVNFELSPGEMAAIDRTTGNVARSSIAPEDIGAWRSGKMFVNDITVSAAVERLQRYHPAWIKIADSALASRRVTGLYDLRTPDGALEALVRPFGGKVRNVTSYGRILSRF